MPYLDLLKCTLLELLQIAHYYYQDLLQEVEYSFNQEQELERKQNNKSKGY